MKLLSKIYSLQAFLAEASNYFQNLEAWSRNPTFQVTNVPCPPPAPHVSMLMEFDRINPTALCANGGERELYDYIKAVMNNEVVAADREKVSDPLAWESEHYQFTKSYNTLRFLSVIQVRSSDLQDLHRNHRHRDQDGLRYLIGPDGTWYAAPEDAKFGWSTTKDGLMLKMKLSFAKSAIEGETLAVSIGSSGTCTCAVRETLTLGQPEISVIGPEPLEYVTQEEFDSAFELHIPGSLIDHQERLKERVNKVFTALIPKEGEFPPLAHLYGTFRYNSTGRRNDNVVCFGSRPDDAFVPPETEYNEEQLELARKSGGYAVYMKVDSFFGYGITEGGRDWLFNDAWPKMSVVERLEFYVMLLSIYQHNRDDNYSAGGIFRNLDKVLA